MRGGVILAVLAASACGGGDAPSHAAHPSAAEFGEPIPLPDVVLAAADGTSWDLRERARGRLTYLFLGYSNCPDACPMTMAALARAFEGSGLPTDRIDVLFVTVDPARDDAQRLGAWLQAMHPGAVALIPTADQLAESFAVLGYDADLAAAAEAAGAEMPHPMSLYVVTPDARITYAYMHGAATPEALREDARLLLAQASG